MSEHGNAAVRVVLHAESDRIAMRSALQTRAPETLRRHALRGLRRVLPIIATDFILFETAGLLLRLVRDFGVLGRTVQTNVAAIVPGGSLGSAHFMVALFLGLLVTGTYGRGDQRHDVARLIQGTALGAALALWDSIWVRGLDITLIQFIITTVGLSTALIAGRHLVVMLLDRMDRRRGAARTLLVGRVNECSSAWASSNLLRRRRDYEVIGVAAVGLHSSSQSLGGVEDLAHLIDAHGIETLYITGGLSEPDLDHVIDVGLAAGCEIIASMGALNSSAVIPKIDWHDGEPVIALTRPSFQARDRLLKRSLDILLGTITLIVTAPLMALIALAVVTTSEGPALFRQERVGRGGRVFRIYKFRTMHHDAENRKAALQSKSLYGDARLFKVESDPRVTRVGAFLRKSSLDELPQLINVLRGEMSLVGPRPPIPSEVSLYEERHYCRFDVKPGMTGPWQVGGRNLIRDFEEVIRLEKSYIQNWTIIRDIVILTKTIPALFRTNEAY
ncbi:MAG TPA: sugar transferase [Longimicrobiales bacterium]